MTSSYLPDAERFHRKRLRRRRIYRVTTTLAAIVVFCTTYALILPAITMERSCTLEEHTHTDACYEQVTAVETSVPACPVMENGVHEHSENCRDENGKLICGTADFIIHTHDEWCYDENGELWCTLPEICAHTHGEACYECPLLHEHDEACYESERGELSCTLEESQGHFHAEECYDESGALVCTITESEGHTHTENCWEQTQKLICPLSEEADENAEPVLVCKQEEIAAHTHTAACYDENGALVCGKLEVFEHQHSEACFETVEVPLDPQELTCTETDEDHIHTKRCYGVWQLSCPLIEHTHTADCNIEQEPEEDEKDEEEEEDSFFCTLPEHRHDESCYDASGLIICGMEEHEHTERCALSPLTEEEIAQIAEVTAQIDALPTSEELSEELGLLEEKMALGEADEEAFTVWYEKRFYEYETVRDSYEALTDAQQCEVANAEKLLQLGELWNSMTLPVNTKSTVEVKWYQERDSYTTYVHSSFLHFVDKEGNPILIDASKEDVKHYKNAQNFTLSWYTVYIDLNSYSYQGAYIQKTADSDEWMPIIKVSYNTADGHAQCWHVTTDDAANAHWYDWEKYNNADAHIYIVFDRKIAVDANYYTNDVNSDIKLRLYNYGSYINSGADKVLPFYQTHAFEAIDGVYKGDLVKNGAPPAMQKTLNEEGYPVVEKDGKSMSLKYLFRKDGADLVTGNAPNPLPSYGRLRTKDNMTTTTWNSSEGYTTQYESIRFDLGSDGGLFTRDADGYYTYNCAKQSAYYDWSSNRFYLSDTLICPGGHYEKTSVCTENFLPFDKIGNGGKEETINGKKYYFTAYTDGGTDTDERRLGIADLGFGMTMEVDFYQPRGGQVNGKDMVFNFTGDDDVWVYVDGVLVLDIGGCHPARTGSINFATGAVEYAADGGTVSTNLRKLFEEAGVSTAAFRSGSNTFTDWTEHKLSFFYLERGGNISSCKLRFNLQTKPEKSLVVEKELTVAGSADSALVSQLQDTMSYRFRVMKATESGEATDEVLMKNTTFTLIDRDGASTLGKIDENGYFSLKSGQRSTFDNVLQYFAENDPKKYVVQELLPSELREQYGDIVVSTGESTGSFEDEIADGAFKGVNSPVLDASLGSFIHYENTINTEKLSTLTLTKRVTGGAPITEETYSFRVTLGGALLPAGTAYTLKTADGTAETKTVETAGLITLRADETAELRVLSGTEYRVEEISAGGAAYSVHYSIDGEAISGSCAEGTITKVGSTVSLSVENQYPAAALNLQKRVNNTADAGATDGAFIFVLSFEVPESFTDRTFSAVYSTGNKEGTVTFRKDEGGRASAQLTLRHDESVCISGLPLGLRITITEENSQGYSVGWQVDGTVSGSNSVTVAAAEQTNVLCTNTTGYVLPSTGGSGTGFYTAAGLVLLGCALLLGCTRRKKRA